MFGYPAHHIAGGGAAIGNVCHHARATFVFANRRVILPIRLFYRVFSLVIEVTSNVATHIRVR